MDPKVSLGAVVGKDHGFLPSEFVRVMTFVKLRLQESPGLFCPKFLSTE